MNPKKIIAVNGSPRKGWNTHLLLEEALKGAAAQGAETEMVHLYDLRFTGCISCFECKRIGGSSLGRCAAKDDLSPVLERIAACDGLLLGSPIYVGEVTAGMRGLFERLTFQYITYRKDGSTFTPRRIPVGLIYTMNIPVSAIPGAGYDVKFKFYEDRFSHIIGPAKTVISTETWQTRDYSKYEMTMFDGDARKKRREEVFPQDLKEAFDLGAELIS
ncbi:MAG: flavodoxin family protein [Treponema sp.]|jgi:multimeric flavodoxin WrbA|nr:flavodoxin family protein [Treponema sp.]